jgi:5-amino-6-(5-phosphoribosylamino)uracil reductase
MANINGPGTLFKILVESDTSAQNGHGLPADFRGIYQGDWIFPNVGSDKPYVYTNFVISHDGRISFSAPGASNGAAISHSNPNDLWLMGLLRARADAVLVGDNSIRLESNYTPLAGDIFPKDERAFKELRSHEGRREEGLLIVLSLDGNLPRDGALFTEAGKEFRTLIATTPHGAAKLAQSGIEATYDVVVLGDEEEAVDLKALMGLLRREYSIETLLCEGGAHVYGALIRDGLVDDEFLTVAPLVIGAGQQAYRPSLVEGVSFMPDNHPTLHLVSLRSAGDYLFMRSTYARGPAL